MKITVLLVSILHLVINDKLFLHAGGIDYVSGPYTVVFHAGEINTTVFVPIFSDTILENNANFTLTINSSSTPDGISGDQATVTIVDDDHKSL